MNEMNPSYCNICGCILDNPLRPESENCGGDCLRCMAESGDPDCIKAMHKLYPHDKRWEPLK